MYIPGVNYKRATLGEAQEDISRFGRIAAAAGEGAVHAAQAAGEQAASDVMAKSYDLGLAHTLQNTALTQTGYDIENKWATVQGVIGVAQTILTEIAMPVYQQKVDNEVAEADRLYAYRMDAAILRLNSKPTRMEEQDDGTFREVSNGDRLQEGWAEAQRAAMEDASRALSLPESKEIQNVKWSDHEIENIASLQKTAYDWDREVVKADWQTHYDFLESMPSPENMDKQVAWLEKGFAAQIIKAPGYTEGLLEVRANRETLYVEDAIREIAGTKDYEAQDRLVNDLEGMINDAQQLQTLGAVATNKGLGIRTTIEKARKADQKEYDTEVSKFTRNRIENLQIIIAADTGSEYIGNELSAMGMALTEGYQRIATTPVMINDATKRETAIKQLNAGVQTRMVGITDRVMNMNGGPNSDEYNEMHAGILTATPAELGFRDPNTGADEKQKMLTAVEGIALRHKAVFVEQAKVRTIDIASSKFAEGLYTTPDSGKFEGDTMGIHYSQTETEVLTKMYQRNIAGIEALKEEGVPEPDGGWWADHDRKAVDQFDKGLPAIMTDDIKNSLGSVQMEDFVAGAERWDALRFMTNRQGQASGKVEADDIRSSLKPSERASLDYWETLTRDGQPLTQLQQEDLELVVGYNLRASTKEREDNESRIRLAYGDEKTRVSLMEDVMEREGYSSDAIDAMVNNPYLLDDLDRKIFENAGAFHPLIAADRAAVDVLMNFGLTDRAGLVQTGQHVLETKLNGGKPMPGLEEAFDKAQEDAGVSSIFSDGGIIETVRARENADGSLMTNPLGKQMWKATYKHTTGLPVIGKDGEEFTFEPEPYNFRKTVAERKKAHTESNKAMYKLGESALQKIYDKYPDMEDDLWNPNTHGWIGTPFDESDINREMDFRATGITNVLPAWPTWKDPSTWWTTFDPDQKKARQLTTSEEQYIRMQVGSKFDRLIEDEGYIEGTEQHALVLSWRAAAFDAMLFNARHNDRAYPSYDAAGFEGIYPYDLGFEPIEGLSDMDIGFLPIPPSR